MIKIRWFIIPLLIVFLSACTDKEDVQPAEKADLSSGTTELIFIEQDGIDGDFQTRMLINKDFIRIDEGGSDHNGFVLFDRTSGSIKSVTTEEQRVFVIKNENAEIQTPDDLNIIVKNTVETEAPKIEGKTIVSHQFIVGEKVCYEVMAVNGLLEEERKALQEYQQVLAKEQIGTIGNMPKDMQTDCLLSNVIYSAADHYSFGFPVAQKDDQGYRRSLKDYKKNIEVNNELFQIPMGYEEFSLKDM